MELNPELVITAVHYSSSLGPKLLFRKVGIYTQEDKRSKVQHQGTTDQSCLSLPASIGSTIEFNLLVPEPRSVHDATHLPYVPMDKHTKLIHKNLSGPLKEGL